MGIKTKKLKEVLNWYLPTKKGLIFSARSKKFIKPRLKKSGYLTIRAYTNDKPKEVLIHRLVALAYLGENKEKTVVNHINGIKTDNRIENLEWSTPSENIKHAYKTGLKSMKGENHNNSKLTNDQAIEIKKMYLKGLRQREIAEVFSIKQATVSNIVTGRRWKHLSGEQF